MFTLNAAVKHTNAGVIRMANNRPLNDRNENRNSIENVLITV